MVKAEVMTASKPTLKRTNSSRQYSEGLQGYIGAMDDCGIYKAFVFTYRYCGNECGSGGIVLKSILTNGKPIQFRSYADGGWQCAKCKINFSFNVKWYTQRFLNPVLDNTGFTTVPSTYDLCYACNKELIDSCGNVVTAEVVRNWVTDLFIYIPQEVLPSRCSTVEFQYQQTNCGSGTC